MHPGTKDTELAEIGPRQSACDLSDLSAINENGDVHQTVRSVVGSRPTAHLCARDRVDMPPIHYCLSFRGLWHDGSGVGDHSALRFGRQGCSNYTSDIYSESARQHIPILVVCSLSWL